MPSLRTFDAAHDVVAAGPLDTVEDAIMRTILLAVHVARDEATKIAAAFAADLRAEGLDVRILDTEVDQLRAAGLEATDVVARRARRSRRM